MGVLEIKLRCLKILYWQSTLPRPQESQASSLPVGCSNEWHWYLILYSLTSRLLSKEITLGATS